MASTLMNVIYISCAGLIGLMVILWFYFKLKFSYWKNLKIKYLEPAPLFGNITKCFLMLSNYQETYEEIYQAMGDEPYIGYYEMNSPLLMVKDPQLISTILVKDFKHFTTRGRQFVFTKNQKLNPLSLHLGSVMGERWRFLRQSISPVFTAAKIKQMQEKLTGTMHMVDNYLDKQMNGLNCTDVELNNLFGRVARQTITSHVFGADNECSAFASSDEFQKKINEAFVPKLSKTWHRLLVSYFPTWLNNILNRAEVDNSFIEYFRRLALDSLQYRRLHGIRGNDILQAMMDLQNSHVDPQFAVSDNVKAVSPKEKFDEVDIVANVFVLLLAGFESTSSALTYCVYELAMNETVQQTLRLEVQKTIEECGILNYDSLKQMSYLDAIVCETLRKYPTGVALSRECTDEYVIPGTDVCIPKGTYIKVPKWSLHHDSRYFPDPDKFDPERFLGENKNSVTPGTYVPFGDGPRACIGKRFADIEMKAAVADMILKYDLKACNKTPSPIIYEKGYTTLHPKTDIWINVTRRKT